MRTLTRLIAAGMLVGIAGCRDATTTTNPDVATAASRGENTGTPATVRLMDACDPATFSGVPGGCSRNGGVTFDQFIAQLTQLQRAPAWTMVPGDLYLTEGAEFIAVNVGGEVHTFTEVEEFGGGRVPELNELIGETEVAEECNELAGSDFLAPGDSVEDEAEEVGDEHYQCCIHPWMRMTVHVREN